MKKDNRPVLLFKVDNEGNPLGFEDKKICHAGNGIRHLAYLVMIFDDQKRLMLARRSRSKLLWPRYWDGTVAGHPYPGENPKAGIMCRIAEETGLSCPAIRPALTFSYEERFGNVGIEKEVCDVFLAPGVRTDRAPINPAEVSEYKIMPVGDVEALIAAGSLEFTPWFKIAFGKCRENGII